MLYVLHQKQFSVFNDTHTPQPFTKALFDEVWEHCDDILSETASRRFRSPEDVNQWLFRYWQLATGSFYPQNTIKKNKYFDLSDEPAVLDEITSAIKTQKYCQIVLNDAAIKNHDYVAARLTETFESILPEKSEFEV